MPRSVSLVGLAQRGVIPQKQFYIILVFYDPVVLKELGLFFASPDELSAFVNALETISGAHAVGFAKAAVLDALESVFGWPVRVANAVQSTFGNIFDLAFHFPTGSEVITSQ
jgi:hypothetical protein